MRDCDLATHPDSSQTESKGPPPTLGYILFLFNSTLNLKAR